MEKPADRAKRTDRRVLRTRKAIMNAFDKLVADGAGRVTVSAIAREADIDRKTFYLHYKSVDELIDYKTELALERIIDTLKAEGGGKTYLERVHIALSEVNAILSANIATYSNIASKWSTDQVLEHFEQVAEPALAHAGIDPDVTNDRRVHMKFQFYIAGALSLYTTWLRSERKEPVETVSAAIEEAIAALHAQDPAGASPSYA